MGIMLGVIMGLVIVFVGIMLFGGLFDDIDQDAIERERAALAHDENDHIILNSHCIICEPEAAEKAREDVSV